MDQLIGKTMIINKFLRKKIVIVRLLDLVLVIVI